MSITPIPLTIRENHAAGYEAVAYPRVLIAELPDGLLLRLMDDLMVGDALAAGDQVGLHLLEPLLKPPTAPPEVPGFRTRWSGEIRTLMDHSYAVRLAEQNYWTMHHNPAERHDVLITVGYGDLIVPMAEVRRYLGREPMEGDRFEWATETLDVVGIAT